MRIKYGIATVVILAMVAAACGDSDEGAGDGGSCDVADLNLATPGQLTVATGEPVFPPWMGAGADENFNVPESKTGYEGALVYELANEMGFTDDQVVFVRTTFDEAITAGAKDWDFNIQQYSITEAREEVVDFSEPYYETNQALVAFADNPVTSAASLDDLKQYKLGAAIGTTSLDFVENVIEPDSDAAVYNDNADAKSALEAGQVDALVFDLPTAYFITAVEIPEASIVGQLEASGEQADEFGMLFEDGNPLVGCVNEALGRLEDAGRLDALEEEWLSQGGDIPTLSS